MTPSLALLSVATGATAAMHTLWAKPLGIAMEKYEIKTPKNVAAFLANIGVECASFTKMVEDLNYSAQGLANTWPNRYAVDQKATVKVPNDLAKSLTRRPEAIANLTYANRMGNGDAASGDGWRYRGQGPMQLTGKANFEAFKRSTGIDVVANPSLLQAPEAGSISAALFWYQCGGNDAGNAGDFDTTVRLVNGAAPSEKNHGPLRQSRYAEALFQALAEFG